MEKVVYLLGAGASYGKHNRRTLPVVDEIPEYLLQVIEDLMIYKAYLNPEEGVSIDGFPKKSYLDGLDQIIEDLKWLHDKSKNHTSIDTFAKKLSIKEKWGALRKMKIATSIFFTILQAKNPVDLRYGAFLASILNNVHQLPPNIKILSWNYDHQLESAFSDFAEIPSIQQLQFQLNAYSKYSLKSKTHHPNEFGYYKLNGTAAIGDRNGSHNIFFIEDTVAELSTPVIKEIIHEFVRANSQKELMPRLSFAWENEGTESVIEYATAAIEDATVLVVIGYSFPYFNREIDRKLFSRLKSLKKIYIQDVRPESISPRVKELLSKQFGYIESNGPDIIPYKETEQFLVPPEL